MGDRDVHDLLPEYLLGTLAPENAARVEEAMAASPALREEAASLGKALFALTEELDPEPLPEDAWENLRAAVQRERTGSATASRSRFRLLGAALAASLVLLTAIGAWGIQERQAHTQLANEQRIIAYWMRSPELRILSLDGVGPGAAPSTETRAEIPPGVVCILPDGRAMLLQPYAAPRGSRYVLYGVGPDGRMELGATDERFLLFDAAELTGVELVLEGRRDELVAEARF
jgi:anti-sigma-K factor RskA